MERAFGGSYRTRKNRRYEVKTHETFSQLIWRLSGRDGLDWMDMDTCPNKDAAIKALETHWRCCFDVGDYHCADQAEEARDEVRDFEGEATSQHWKPTEQEIRDCCGIWVDPVGIKTRVIPFFEWGQGKSLLDFECADEFHSFMDDKGLARLEPIPEQCIPKPETPKESYQIRFPLLAGAMT